MNKQINSINGYSCVQAQVKMQLNFQNVINAHVTCLRTHFIPPPPHPKILYETLEHVQKRVNYWSSCCEFSFNRAFESCVSYFSP